MLYPEKVLSSAVFLRNLFYIGILLYPRKVLSPTVFPRISDLRTILLQRLYVLNGSWVLKTLLLQRLYVHKRFLGSLNNPTLEAVYSQEVHF
jgi:hypothetical protein